MWVKDSGYDESKEDEGRHGLFWQVAAQVWRIRITIALLLNLTTDSIEETLELPNL